MAVQCPTIKKPSLINRNSSRAWQSLSRVNVTWLLRRLQVKIENIYLFKILIKKHENVFKSWLCPNFLLLPKKSELPKIWGGCSPPRSPGPYAYARGAYIFLRGDLTKGFLRCRFGRLIFGGAYTRRGLFSKFYGFLKPQWLLPNSEL